MVVVVEFGAVGRSLQRATRSASQVKFNAHNLDEMNDRRLCQLYVSAFVINFSFGARTLLRTSFAWGQSGSSCAAHGDHTSPRVHDSTPFMARCASAISPSFLPIFV